MNKAWWIERALAWKDKALVWKEKYLDMRESRNEWRKSCEDCEEALEECEEEPDPDPTPDKKLAIKNGKILYGGSPVKLCGVSRWEALWRATGEHDPAGDWGKYSLEWYENKLIESGINYVRHGGIKDTQFLYDHCKRMKDAGIIVEVTVFRAKKNSRGVLARLDDMKAVADLGNVFFDINNEFIDEPKNVIEAIRVAKILKSQGCIISGGAWSGTEGLGQSDEFYSKYDNLDINSHHREWNEYSFKADVWKGKPVVWNEYFAMRAGMSLAKTKQLMRLAFECGVQGVQYYGFRFDGIPGLKKYDPFHWKDILDYAGGLVK